MGWYARTRAITPPGKLPRPPPQPQDLYQPKPFSFDFNFANIPAPYHWGGGAAALGVGLYTLGDMGMIGFGGTSSSDANESNAPQKKRVVKTKTPSPESLRYINAVKDFVRASREKYGQNNFEGEYNEREITTESGKKYLVGHYYDFPCPDFGNCLIPVCDIPSSGPFVTMHSHHPKLDEFPSNDHDFTLSHIVEKGNRKGEYCEYSEASGSVYQYYPNGDICEIIFPIAY